MGPNPLDQAQGGHHGAGRKGLEHSSLKCQPGRKGQTPSSHRFPGTLQVPLLGGPPGKAVYCPGERQVKPTVLGGKKTATHSLSLINTVNASLEPKVTFIHYPLEGQGAQTPELGYRRGKKKHIPAEPQTDFLTLSPPDVSHSPPTHIHTHQHLTSRHPLVHSLLDRPHDPRSLTSRPSRGTHFSPADFSRPPSLLDLCARSHHCNPR